jgi:hypothetical protein
MTAMGEPKLKLTGAEKRSRRERNKKYTTTFLGGKQKSRIAPPQIDGMDLDEFIRQNADPIWLHQNGMWAK